MIVVDSRYRSCSRDSHGLGRSVVKGVSVGRTSVVQTYLKAHGESTMRDPMHRWLLTVDMIGVA